ncbi:MAG: AsmA family protein [Bacteroidales bacterium]|nr:AsmA family protein [Bacteroidales bacterium]
MENQENIEQVAQTEEVKGKRKMKKGVKIALISFLSLLGFLVVSVAVLMWLILTPARLTSIVNKLSDKYILCDSHFDNVDLTLVKTFPFVGLKVQGVSLVNPMDGAASDTLAYIDELCIGLNIKEYLFKNNIELTELKLSNATANLYIDCDGKQNFDIFPKSEDTTSEPTKMPELISLKCIEINNLNASYIDDQSNMKAFVRNADIDVEGRYESFNIQADVTMNADRIVYASKADSSCLDADLRDFNLKLNAKEKYSNIDCDLSMAVKGGHFVMNGTEYTNDAVEAHDGNLLMVDAKLSADLMQNSVDIKQLTTSLKDYQLAADGMVMLPTEEKPMYVDVDFSTNKWHVSDLLAMLPESFTSWTEGMSLDADAELSGRAKGRVSDTELPEITANLILGGGSFNDPTILPYSFSDISADIDAVVNLNDNMVSSAKINSLKLYTGRNKLELSGQVDDLLGIMQADAKIKGSLFLADIQKLIPQDVNFAMDGLANLNLDVSTNLEKLQQSDFKHMRMTGMIGVNELSVRYDTIFAHFSNAKIDVNLPSKMNRKMFDELLSATINSSTASADLPNIAINGAFGKNRIDVAISDIFDSLVPFRMVCDFSSNELKGAIDSLSTQMADPVGTFALIPESMTSDKIKYKLDLSTSAMNLIPNDSVMVYLAGLSIKGGANYDPSKTNTLQQWSPNFDVDLKRSYINMDQLAYVIQIPDMKFNYKPERCEIASANVVFGNSDFYLSGAVTGLEKWLSHEALLKGDLYFTSNYTNVDDLLDVFSGMGTNADTLEVQRKEDNVDTAAHPFIVPKDVDFTLHTRIKEATAFDNDLREVAGDVQIRDGVAVLNQVGFVCKAARMQLTGMYRTPRVNHIFVGLDFHLLDINIQELIDMIPYVDTIVPLLNDLEGAADFHLCAETYVNAFYKPKMSTLRGAASLTGQNLVVLDNKDIDRIAKLLQLKAWREEDSKIHVDSLDVAMTVFRKELEVYPFLLSLHKYQIVAEGRHNLDNNYDYHVELVESPLPVRLAVDVYGTLPKLKFDLSPKLRYKNLFRPSKRSDVDEAVLRLKALIRQSLEANVKSETREYQGLDSLDN